MGEVCVVCPCGGAVILGALAETIEGGRTEYQYVILGLSLACSAYPVGPG